ncbi:MAG TPA: hypothetical protein DEP53_10905 [Bacteroidetes bacterium]|nr:hypothetical protein [Bacteroidota bacterium]
MTALALELLARKVELVREHEIPLRKLRRNIRRRVVAHMTERALRVDLFLVAALAVFVRRQQIIRRQLARWCLGMAIGARHSRIADVEFVREFDGRWSILGRGILAHGAHKGKSEDADDSEQGTGIDPADCPMNDWRWFEHTISVRRLRVVG